MLLAAAAHLFVTDVEHPVPDETDRHHLVRVLRVRPGELVTVGDGAGRWRPCRLSSRARLEPDGAVITEPRPEPAITIGFAAVKGDRPEWAVQKLTELGVDRIVPFVAARSVVRWDVARAEHHAQRWRRIAREAAMQSRRAWLPDVLGLRDFADVIDHALATAGPIALAQFGGGAPSLACPSILVGPEGGWAPEELGGAAGRVGLGPTVFRTETAAVAAAVLLVSLRSGTVAARC